MVCGGRVESGSLVFANKNGGRQEGEGVYMGGGSTKAKLKASSCLSPTPVSLVGPEDGAVPGMCLVLEAFVVSGLRGLSPCRGRTEKTQLAGNPGQPGTSIQSKFYRHVRTWEPVRSLLACLLACFFFFFFHKGSHIHTNPE